MKPEDLKQFGWVTFALERLFKFFESVSPANRLFKTRQQVQVKEQSQEELRVATIRRARSIDTYVALWIALEVIALPCLAPPRTWFSFLACILAGFRVFEIMQAAINIVMFDPLRFGSRPNYVASVVRTLLLNIVNFFEMILCFGIIYAANLRGVTNASDWYDAVYFSAITQLTIGYGDMQPLAYLKGCVLAQGLCGFLFSILIIGRFISFLPRSQSILGDHDQEPSPKQAEKNSGDEN